jgi:hypothetical protein
MQNFMSPHTQPKQILIASYVQAEAEADVHVFLHSNEANWKKH